MGTVKAHCLEGLSDQDCWSLFKRRAFANNSLDLSPNVVTIGKKIVKRCQGSPLAVKNFGAHLKFVEDEKEWDTISKTDICDLPEDKYDILPNIRTSYHQLPLNLKLCFAFCSMFPKEYIFQMESLVLLWIAEGFVQSKGSKQLEDAGNEYFLELLSKSFFQYSHVDPLDGRSRYKMHGLVHDLAQSVMHDECFKFEANGANEVCNIFRNVRHVSLIIGELARVDYDALYKSNSLRTLLFMGGYRYRIEHIPNDLFLKLKRLRVLDLSHTSISELPGSVGNVKHLRYLDLSWIRIKRLPQSTTTLVNLQTLKLIKCLELLELPIDMKNLINLRHLHISFSTVLLRILPFSDRRLLELPKYLRNMINLRDMDTSFNNNLLANVLPFVERSSQLHPFSRLISTPPGMGRLTSLQTLSSFVVTKTSGCGVEELKDLVNLRGALRISKLENVINVMKAKEASLMSKPDIHDLTLHWSERNLLSLQNEILDEEVLEESDEYPCLRELTIWDCPKMKQLGPLPLTLTVFEIANCKGLKALPSLPSIQKLVIGQCDKTILSSLVCFSSLSSLTICHFPNLDCFPDGLFQHLTSLKELKIIDCDELTSLPKEDGLQKLISLEHLELCSCLQLKSLHDEEFPSTLKSFRILSCPSLITLPREIQSLTSLQLLEIWKCPRIRSLPGNQLPITIQILSIRGCPALKEIFQKGGRNWHKIAHIPSIRMDSDWLQQEW
ncbi:Disease resistance protein rga2 [Thalictrum thalictroides]|uniref:Disease resistance protein rga2 n=1 Tax=Thalictrum thalictroides TaxID=46969 RepID=A0A7J6WJ15_THATH|nr:Disease resistance protein rga2 [Thalictrum thalictroides]